MKPKTKLQKTVMEGVVRLPPLTSSQERALIRKANDHYIKYYRSKGEYVCLECGHTWSGKGAKRAKCPHCQTSAKVDTAPWRAKKEAAYVMHITKYKDFQVLRMFSLKFEFHVGQPVKHTLSEVFQKWITPDGKSVTVSRARNFGRYIDSWNLYSDMEVRVEHEAHNICPWAFTVDVRSIIPKLKRNGFTGAMHDCNPAPLFSALLTNNKIETLWKLGQYQLVRYLLNTHRYRLLDDYWPTIRVAIRHGYIISDPSNWIDLVECLSLLGEDIRNPRNICPDDITKAHNYWHERHQRQLQAERLKKMQEQAKKYEANYRNDKAKFFDLVFRDNEITVEPLKSVEEFAEEGAVMHHCVFSAGYYKQADTLILHATTNGAIIATIELNLKTLQIIQCRGVCNQVPEHYDRIIALIEANINEIAKRCAA